MKTVAFILALTFINLGFYQAGVKSCRNIDLLLQTYYFGCYNTKVVIPERTVELQEYCRKSAETYVKKQRQE